ncbi:MAG TPA: RNA polymerase sigma factor [Solirubrobacteraceae bacterium]|jgi:RNA polymerase sigma-70 factor (ECF subfamily)|nr:RNA polymerase sigma factor [Solirubrobacteraceae bacterium]
MEGAMGGHAERDARLLATTATDPDAFAEFYDLYEEAVLLYMLRRTSSAELAADLTAEVFASALSGAAGFEYTGVPPAAWLFRIAHNVLVDSYRAARVQDDMRRRLGMPPMTLTDEMTEHLERLSDRAAGAEAMDLLTNLPPEQRAAVVAHILEERDYEDIAAEMQCSASVVRKRVSRGLAVLRGELKQGEHHA